MQLIDNNSQSIFNETFFDPSHNGEKDVCLSQALFEMHRRTIVDFTSYDYPKMAHNVNFIEILIKIVLCTLSITASLFGNAMVIYSILFKPYMQRKKRYAAFALAAAAAANSSSLTRSSLINRNNTNMRTNNLEISQSSPMCIVKDDSFKDNRNQRCDSASSSMRRATLHDSKARVIQHVNTYMPNCFAPKTKTVNYFVLNLCFCDLMIVLWCSWVHMVNSISSGWRMGAFFCKFNTYVQVMCVIASISTLSVISFDRFRGIVLTMNEKLSRKDSVKIIIFIWIFSIIAAFPILLYRKQYMRSWKDHEEVWCADNWPRQYIYKPGTDCVIKFDEPLRRVYYTFISFVLFFLPIFIMICCYGLIIKKMSNNVILNFYDKNSLERNFLNRRRQKVNTLLICLVVSFTVCWSPAQMFILFEAYKNFSGNEVKRKKKLVKFLNIKRNVYNAENKLKKMPSWFNWMYFLVFLLAYSSSAINPIIYTGLNKFYKKKFNRLLNRLTNQNQLGKNSIMSNALDCHRTSSF